MQLRPYEYIHVLDRNNNVTRIEIGPINFILQDHEEVVTGSTAKKMTVLENLTYALVEDPVDMDKDGEPKKDKHGQTKVKHGEQEIRTYKDYEEPWPLYPGEKLLKVSKLIVIPRNNALRVKANRDFKDGSESRQAGDEWFIQGPAIYTPRIEVNEVKTEEPIIIHSMEGVKVRARYRCKDLEGKVREAGEEWLVTKRGFYMLGIDEVFGGLVKGEILTETKAIQISATKTFTDIYGIERKAGEEWLVTCRMAAVHLLDVYERFVQNVNLTVLDKSQYCYLSNPVEGGSNVLGKKILVKGPKAFFLKPGEELEGGVKPFYILGEDEALLMKALENFTMEEEKKTAGDKWMIYGPLTYVPPVQVKILERRKRIPMDSLEGIYVRDTQNGSVSMVKGKTYMLKAHEELWNMDLNDNVERLIARQMGARKVKYKMVSYKAPFNTAVQVYDYKKKEQRVIFGPDLVTLEPDEQFTVCFLSGKTPKQPGVIRTIHLELGPNFSTDGVQVETSDHARLEIHLSYNWKFIYEEKDLKSCSKLFNVRDFIGDMCKAMASRVRGAVASQKFDVFHKASAKIIRTSIFGMTAEGKVGDSFFFKSNGLNVFNVDIKSVEPVDKKTRQRLQETVNQAIEITTKMQEQEAQRIADKHMQEAEGILERQILQDDAKIEESKKELLKYETASKEIEKKGVAIAEAQANSKAMEIAAEADVALAENAARAKKERELGALEFIKAKHTLELEHETKLANLKITKAEKLATIESTKFQDIMDSIGKQTLVDVAMVISYYIYIYIYI